MSDERLAAVEKQVQQLASDVAEIVTALRAEQAKRTRYAKLAFLFGGAAAGAVAKALEGLVEAAAAHGVDVWAMLSGIVGG